MEQHKKYKEVQRSPKAQWRQQEELLVPSCFLEGSTAGWWARTGALQLHLWRCRCLQRHLNNIPYGQSSAKLSVTRSLGHLVTRFLGHSVSWSLGQSVTRSFGHSATRSLDYFVTRSLSQSVTRSLSQSVIRSLGH